jgi:MFS family permease
VVAPERLVTAAVLALGIACAIRGLWSPCGLSMLSTLTPLGERSRGHAYGWSISWYVLGAALGGACLGACLSAGAEVAAALGVHRGAIGLVVTAVAVVVCLAADARLGGLRLPERPRQVNERWFERYRPWAYSSGFGWQIGTGFATYVMTDALYAFVVAAMLLLDPGTAFVMGVVFGVLRGASLLVGFSVSTPERLRSLHARLAALAPWSIGVPAAAELAVLLVVAARGERVALLAPSAIVGGMLVVVVVRHARSASALTVATS